MRGRSNFKDITTLQIFMQSHISTNLSIKIEFKLIYLLIIYLLITYEYFTLDILYIWNIIYCAIHYFP